MASSANFLAIDLGASNGRAMLGALADGRVSLREVHRFANGPIRLRDGLYWDAPRLFGEIKTALGMCAKERIGVTGVGVDTWGVDYGLLSDAGELLGPPRHYRDVRTRGVMDGVIASRGRDSIYRATGIQFMEINTVYQLLADRRDDPARLDAARTLLFMPDLMHYWLTGERRSELSIASTSQMLDPERRAWADGLVSDLGLPGSILPEVGPAGHVVGSVLASVREETGVGDMSVVAPACHDTGSAVVATPGFGEDWAYISCGTWSLVGVELDRPVRTSEAMRANFTNELGVGGTVRFLKNLPGLWILQECRRAWGDAGRAYTHEQIDAMAREAVALECLFDPDAPSLAEFGSMPDKVRRAAGALGRVPESDGAIVRAVLESLAIRHRLAIEELERLTGRRINVVHLVGGGSRNDLLCRFTADAANREVRAGPVEATAMGNLLVQAMAHGELGSRDDIRRIAAKSEPQRVYEPRHTAAWDTATERVRGVLAARGS